MLCETDHCLFTTRILSAIHLVNFHAKKMDIEKMLFCLQYQIAMQDNNVGLIASFEIFCLLIVAIDTIVDKYSQYFKELCL